MDRIIICFNMKIYGFSGDMQMTKKHYSHILLLMVVLLVLCSCSENSSVYNDSDFEEIQNNKTTQLNKLSTENGIANPEIIDDSFSVFEPFSIVVQDNLVNKTIAFTSWIDDIERTEEGIFLKATNYDSNFYLKMSEENYREFMSMIDDEEQQGFSASYSEFCILAKVDSVRKTSAEINSYGNDDEGYSIEIVDTDQLVFYGSCIDISIFE